MKKRLQSLQESFEGSIRLGLWSSIMDFLNYIRNLFSFSFPEPLPFRKRRVINDFEEDIFSSPKFRRIQNPLRRQMDDIIISGTDIRRPIKSPRNSNLCVKDVIVLDDDGHTIENKPRKKYTSTPSDMRGKEVSFQDDDDIKFVGEFKATNTRKSHAPKPFSLLQSLVADRRNELNSHKNAQLKPTVNGNSGSKRPFLSAYTTRLEDKKEYQHLLESHFSRENSSNNSSQYFTPNSNLFKYNSSGSRSSRILELSRKSSRNSSVGPLIDLTQEEVNLNGSSSSSRTTVKDRIKRVLDSYGAETVEIPDSESEHEVFPRPPSPKPDIKVDPINSFKTIVDTSYVSNKEWLADLVANHRKKIEARANDIKHLEESSKKLNDINRDIRIGNLTRQIDKCLLIKDTVLPIEEAEPELPQLTPEQYSMIDKAFRGNPNEVLVRKFNLNITRKDILTLAGLNWLNDEVINFYMNLIMERSTEGKGRYPKVHCFNTFFYPKLLKDGPESLRRWTRRIDLFSMEIICVPIHLGVHWCMSIIDLRNLTIKYYDSMGSNNQKCLNALRSYLESEHLDKKKTSYDTSDFQLECVKEIPQQMNGSDCGMFSCTFAEFYTRDARFTFKQDDMPLLRSKMVVEILTGELLIK